MTHWQQCPKCGEWDDHVCIGFTGGHWTSMNFFDDSDTDSGTFPFTHDYRCSFCKKTFYVKQND